jgi:5'-3' exonuclease
VAGVRSLPPRLHRHTAGERPLHRGAREGVRRSGGPAIAGATLFVDAASLAYRAYHAVPDWRADDGTQVNAALGFLNFLSRLIPDRKPSRLFVAKDDDWRPQFRVDAMPSYKSHRVAGPDDPPDPVDPQMGIIFEILDAFGITVVAAKDHEAEDVIATLVTRTEGPAEIVTGDRDLFALVKDPNVRVLYTLRGVSELAEVDEAYIRAKYGIPGDRYYDYAVLRGDPSDGLPGVRGIGEKTASGLVAKYGSLDGILSAKDLSATIRAKLRLDAEYLAAARKVVWMPRDAPVEGGDGAIPHAPADAAKVERLGERYRLAASTKRLADALRARATG